MPNRAWKQVERRVARKLGGTRIVLSGRNNMGAVGDILLDGYTIEAKSGRQVPKTVIAWLETLRELTTDGRIPLLVMQPKNRKEMIVVVTLTDLARILGLRAEGDAKRGANP